MGLGTPHSPFFSSPPQYEHLREEELSHVLSTVLPQLQCLHIRTPPRRKVLKLNAAPEAHASATLNTVEGVGLTSINKILTERWLNGDYLGAEDFDRRVRGIKFTRLEELCNASDVSISLAASPSKTPVVHRPCYMQDRCERPPSRNPTSCLTLATWNTARMSTQSPRYQEKLRNLLRLVRDSQVHVLCLQEVCAGVPEQVCTTLSHRLGTRWAVFPRGDSNSPCSDRSLVILFRADTITVQRSIAHQIPNLNHGSIFHRAPQLAFISRKNDTRNMVALLHVHLSQWDPREEINSVALIARKLEHFLNKHCHGRASLLVAGDFNMNSDSLAFESMRKTQLVEVVRPVSSDACPPHAYKVIQSATTAGGHWYDNVWIQKRNRKQIRNAWCFDFGGRGQNLEQSGYEFAAERRAGRSDHLPVVVRMVLGDEDKDD